MICKLLTSALTALALLLPVLTNAQQNQSVRGCELCSQGRQLRANPSSNPLMSPNAPRHKYDVLNYELDLDIFHCYDTPYPRNFDGTCLITFRVDSTLNSIQLDADNTSLQVISAGLNGTSFTHEDNLLTVSLDRTYHNGDTARVFLNYRHLNVIDNAFNVGNGFVFTDCEPEGARKWFPCYDKPSDKATLTLRSKVPLNVKLGSNGSLADSVVVADSLWYTWVSRDPIATYIMVLTSRVNYNLDIVYWEKPGPPFDVIPIRFYYNPGENPGPIKQMIVPLADFYYSLFGDHPFEKDGFATLNPMFQWGGMENQTLTSLCQGCWYSSLIAHEFAHQWFGDMITCATWADLWLNEGFATYIEALWNGEVNGQQAYIDELEGNAAYYLAANPGWPISDPDWATNPPGNNVLFNYAITYMKGSCVLYMYRYIVGDDLFFSSIYDYANDTENFRYQSATIPDFIDKMNESTGQDLNWFFEEWLYQPNHPVYDNSYSFENLGGGWWNVHFYTEQVQANSGFFKMPVDLKISFSDASDTTIRVMNDVNGQGFTFLFAKQPVSLRFDPDNQIILKQASTVVSSGLHKFNQTTLHSPEPNPAGSSTVIPFDLAGPGDVTIKVSDLTGRTKALFKLDRLQAGPHKHRLDLAGYSKGTYIVTLETAGGSCSEKLLVR